MIKAIAEAKKYGAKWECAHVDDLALESQDMSDDVQVVQGDYTLSCCFTLLSSKENVYFPCDEEWSPQVGSTLSLKDLLLKTLSRGEEECYKVIHKDLVPDWKSLV